jgi:hypothetical protein
MQSGSHKQRHKPVRDRFGYFIYQVEEKRVQPLDEAKTAIENGLHQQKLRGALSIVQAESNVVLNPRYFGEPPAAAPALPGSSPSSPQNKYKDEGQHIRVSAFFQRLWGGPGGSGLK